MVQAIDNLEDDVFVTLTVSGDPCQSQPVERIVPPIIDRFELLTGEADGDEFIEMMSIPLSVGQVIPRSGLEGSLFVIRAYPIPLEVASIDFELGLNTVPIASGSSLNDNGRYLLSEGGFLEILEGNYNVVATPQSLSGLTGATAQMIFTIEGENLGGDGDGGGVILVTDDRDVAPPPPAAMSGETLSFLRRRDSGYRAQINELEADAGLAQTEGFIKAKGFLSFQNGLDELDNRYGQAMDALLKQARKAKKGRPRRTKLLQLMAIATYHMLDRHVVSSPNEASPESLEMLATQLEAMKKLGLETGPFKKAWKGSQLKKQLNAKAADQYNKALK